MYVCRDGFLFLCVFFNVGGISKNAFDFFDILSGLYEQPHFMRILIKKSVLFCNSLSLRNAIYRADGSTEMTAYAL